MVVYGSLNSCDPGNIYEVVEQLKSAKIRVSVVGWNAEVFILKKLATETLGTYHIPLDKNNFRELLYDHSPPPPAVASKGTFYFFH